MARASGLRRPIGYRPRGMLTRCCDLCRSEPRTPAQVADVEVMWLVDGLGDTPAPPRYCRACQPVGQIDTWECEQCCVGPLLAGRWARRDDLFTAAAFADWLRETGWAQSGRLCPWCAGRRRVPPPDQLGA